ncbi:MAG TPA: hypothetical protein VGT78_11790 [Rhizomicrobium sp.]|nr:hypothetical protein [Rhizomicrobium sp.]
MRKVLISLLMVLFAGSAAEAQLFTHQYHGKDAGWLVISIGGGEDQEANPISLFYDQVDGSEHGSVHFSKPSWTALSFGSPDYREGDEAGRVIVRSLKPGQYQMDGFLTHLANRDFSDTFRMPFVIRPGQTTYLGNFRFREAHQKGFVGYLRARDFYFEVKNRARRDIGIADHQDKPPRGKVIVALPDLVAVNSPLFAIPDDQLANH